LLDARHQVTPFRYRRRALAALSDWCADPASPVHLLLGPAGVGKTRLAVRLAEELPDDWTTGSAHPDHEGAAVRAARDLPGQVLVVVDHADTRADLTEAVRELVRPGAEHVRLLLIARSEEPDLWWYQAFTAVRSTARADELDTTGRTVLGPVVHTRDDQDQLFAQAVDAFAHQIGVRTPGVHMGHAELDAPILMIQAAALVAVLRRPGRPVNVDDTLWRELSDHETGVWHAAAHRLHLDLLADTQRRIVAWAALLGGQDEDTVIGWLGRMSDLANADRDKLHRIAEWLHALCPGTSPTWLTVVEPSMLADHLVVDELTRGSALADSMLDALGTGQVARMVHLLGRVAVTEPSVRALIERMLRDAPAQVIPAACRVASGVVPLDRMIAACIADRTVELRLDLLDQLWQSLPGPEETVLLRWTVVAVARRRADGTDDVDRLTDLAAACTSVGEWQEALTAAIRAVAAGRLVPDRTASLAKALRVRCRTERGMRRLADAQAAGSESVALLRELADADRSAYLVELASSLCRLADAQRYAGDLDAALGHGREAVRLLREAGTDRALLGTALRVLGVAERTAGHFDEGRTTGQESVDLWRELADARPDAYRHELA
ncbi:MAG TPA: tetratricopeptide repeat protein, partial [Pseudonocardiaceae bacterium]|nr:tetratricopeptide repeat protein [Pseudonocardiaceae bacterium]